MKKLLLVEAQVLIRFRRLLILTESQKTVVTFSSLEQLKDALSPPPPHTLLGLLHCRLHLGQVSNHCFSLPFHLLRLDLQPRAKNTHCQESSSSIVSCIQSPTTCKDTPLNCLATKTVRTMITWCAIFLHTKNTHAHIDRENVLHCKSKPLTNGCTNPECLLDLL